jgi:Effector Associated Constant Component 1
MSDQDATNVFELAIEPHNDQYHPDDDRWRNQVASLYRELNEQVDTEQRSITVAGTKGSIDQIVLALGGAGVFTAMVECFHAWLGRDRARSIAVSWDENGTHRYVTLTGDAIDLKSVHEIAKAAAARVGGQPWPASTAPS